MGDRQPPIPAPKPANLKHHLSKRAQQLQQLVAEKMLDRTKTSLDVDASTQKLDAARGALDEMVRAAARETDLTKPLQTYAQSLPLESTLAQMLLLVAESQAELERAHEDFRVTNNSSFIDRQRTQIRLAQELVEAHAQLDRDRLYYDAKKNALQTTPPGKQQDRRSAKVTALRAQLDERVQRYNNQAVTYLQGLEVDQMQGLLALLTNQHSYHQRATLATEAAIRKLVLGSRMSSTLNSDTPTIQSILGDQRRVPVSPLCKGVAVISHARLNPQDLAFERGQTVFILRADLPNSTAEGMTVDGRIGVFPFDCVNVHGKAVSPSSAQLPPLPAYRPMQDLSETFHHSHGKHQSGATLAVPVGYSASTSSNSSTGSGVEPSAPPAEVYAAQTPYSNQGTVEPSYSTPSSQPQSTTQQRRPSASLLVPPTCPAPAPPPGSAAAASSSSSSSVPAPTPAASTTGISPEAKPHRPPRQPGQGMAPVAAQAAPPRPTAPKPVTQTSATSVAPASSSSVPAPNPFLTQEAAERQRQHIDMRILGTKQGVESSKINPFLTDAELMQLEGNARQQPVPRTQQAATSASPVAAARPPAGAQRRAPPPPPLSTLLETPAASRTDAPVASHKPVPARPSQAAIAAAFDAYGPTPASKMPSTSYLDIGAADQQANKAAADPLTSMIDSVLASLRQSISELDRAAAAPPNLLAAVFSERLKDERGNLVCKVIDQADRVVTLCEGLVSHVAAAVKTAPGALDSSNDALISSVYMTKNYTTNMLVDLRELLATVGGTTERQQIVQCIRALVENVMGVVQSVRQVHVRSSEAATALQREIAQKHSTRLRDAVAGLMDALCNAPPPSPTISQKRRVSREE
ncbi:hypothetical protein CAOG_01771 [Capsaspora owczarzaki ATCC 30864]|uniref:SH3 domain-containing protein n=1 Tax=Capsaspora owczarzaki (strain ATCC 30864) TaxID=595528 RepID=A0A0D2WJY4_CAPO3|nr:hypothetical protein CAOG_01771 [Capsaspora owczarzaki ATCC 30864]KJE90460.1 hypothetical protein CAOG_001771 [Capsaspora owczarzaki ATCC 30864]|eukprot:XP_004364639.1 hypothetical protein CAOG_01771 [Capsaspora owczarzaki ATCC 30864]